MKTIKATICSLILASLFVLPLLAMAQGNTVPASSTPTSNHILNRLTNVASLGGYQTNGSATTAVIVGTILGAFLGFLGLVFLVLMVIAGYNWMTAQGNEEQVKKAQQNIKHAIIGLLVAISAWSLWTFVFQHFILASQ
jgi:hypothetical protein